MDECQGRNQRIRGNIYVSKSQPFMVVSSSFFNKRPQKSVRKIMVATNDEEAQAAETIYVEKAEN